MNLILLLPLLVYQSLKQYITFKKFYLNAFYSKLLKSYKTYKKDKEH